MEAAETFMATRTVGDAQVSEVRYDVRHDGRHNEDLWREGGAQPDHLVLIILPGCCYLKCVSWALKQLT